MPRAQCSIRLGLALLLLAGCAGPTPAASSSGTSIASGTASSGGASSADPSVSPTAAQATPVTFAGAPAQVNLREPLPSCGVESVPGNTPDQALRRCFLDAFTAGRPAELVVAQTTIEGDPITMIYRTRPGQPIEVFVDFTHDAFGSGSWETYGCTGMHEIRPTDPSGLPVTEVFQLDGCTEARKIS